MMVRLGYHLRQHYGLKPRKDFVRLDLVASMYRAAFVTCSQYTLVPVPMHSPYQFFPFEAVYSQVLSLRSL